MTHNPQVKEQDHCTDVAEFLQLMHQVGDVFEVRSIKCPDRRGGQFRSTVSGYFDDVGKAVEAICKIESREPPAVYITLNPVNRDLLARCANRIQNKAENTSSDADVVSRRWLFIDIDPKRPAGISATDSEVAYATAVSDAIQSELRSLDWPEPLQGMSGNGRYLMYRIELPNDDASRDLVRDVLKGLAHRHNTEHAEVDCSTFNASRICKVLGTWARKGDSLSERPHRKSWFIYQDKPMGVVPAELLLTVAAWVPAKAPVASITARVGDNVLDRASRYLSKMDPSIEGMKGHNKLLVATSAMVRGFNLNDDDAFHLLASEFNQRCVPPWSEREIRHKISEARSKGDRPFGYLLTEGVNAVPGRNGASIRSSGRCIMSVELRKYRSLDGRVSIEVLYDGRVVVSVDCDVASDEDVRRCVGVISDAAPDLDRRAIENELRSIDPFALELIDENGMVWGVPEGLPDPLPPVAAYSSDLLPRCVGDAVDDIAERMQCPPDFPAAAMLVAMAAVIGCRVGIRPRQRDDWLVVPNLWGCVVGRPSLKKSPAIASAEKRIRGIEAREQERMAGALRQAELDRVIGDAEIKALRKKLDAAAKIGDRDEMQSIADSIQAIEEREYPVARRIITTDPTIEKLCDLLNVHRGGMLLWVDELVGWMRSLDRDDQAGVRQQFLTLWNGHGRLNIDRISRGEMVVESPCVSVFGCCTPGGLGSYIAAAVRGGRGDDGLIQRLQVTVWPDSPREYRQVDRWPDGPSQQALRAVFERLADLDPETFAQVDAEQPGGIPWVRFDVNAQSVFDRWESALQQRLRLSDLPEAMESHLAKFASLVPSLALIIDLAMGNRGAVSAQAATMAVRWAEYLESHAGRMYSIATCPERQVALPLLRRLIVWPKGESIRIRSIQKKGWGGLTDGDAIHAAIDLLMECGWLQSIDRRPTVGRPTVDYVVHPEAAEFLKPYSRTTTETGEITPEDSFGGFAGATNESLEKSAVPNGRVRGVIE